MLFDDMSSTLGVCLLHSYCQIKFYMEEVASSGSSCIGCYFKDMECLGVLFYLHLWLVTMAILIACVGTTIPLLFSSEIK